MRRINVFLGAAALIVPAVVSLTASTAQAATGGLKVATLTRAGAQLNGNITVVNLSSGSERYETSGRTLSVAPGHYAVLGDVWNPKDNTDTVGAQLVTVSAAKTVTATIDARKGRVISLGLSSSPGTGYQRQTEASVCAYLPDACFGSVTAFNDAGRVYAIPNPSQQVRIAYSSSWNKNNGQDVYIGRGYSAAGIPSSIVGTFSRSAMTTVSAQVRRGSNFGTSQSLSVTPEGPDPIRGLYYQTAVTSTNGPFRSTLHLSPGTWTLSADDASDGGNVGYLYQRLAAAPGRKFAPVFFRSTFGPAGWLPWTQSGRVQFDISNMFQDPTSQGSDGIIKATSTLSLGGRTIATGSETEWGGDNSGFSAKLPSAGWYTMSVAASRYHPTIPRPAYMLSTAATLKFHFYASPKTDASLPGFLTQFIPAGLNLHSAALPKSTTDVTLWLARPGNPNAPTPADTVKSVQTAASYDGGRTWHAVGLTHSGGHWTAHVVNPASGAVSLRSTVTDTHGNSVVTTVYRAYAIA